MNCWKYLSTSLLACTILIGNINAQNNTQTIRGEIRDATNQGPLIGATITLLETDPLLGTITDEKGRFEIPEVPVGRYNVSISYIGYVTFVQTNVFVGVAEETLLNIELNPETLNLGEVVITSDQRTVTNEAAVVNAQSFKVEELSRIPGGIDDPARMARKFAGVSPNASILTNNIAIRGNASRAVRWRLDDMDIYNPNHFGILGDSGGSITIFSQRLLTSTDFYSGAFPADYGNALGGVFDMRFRNGNTEKRQHSIQLSFLGVDLATEGPLSKNGNASYIANYRFSTTTLLNRFLDLGAIPLFQDLSFKLHFKLPNSGTINVFGIGGISDVSVNPVLDTLVWEEQGGANLGSISETITGTVGVAYVQPLSEKTYFKSILIGTGIQVDQKRYYLNRDLVSADTIRKALDRDFRLSWQGYINHRFSKRHTHRSGIIAHSLHSNVRFVQGPEDFSNTSVPFLGDTLRFGEGSSALFQAYTRSQFYPGERWQINVGLHAMYLVINGEVSVEPRLGVRYQLSPKQSINFGYGLHSQMEPFFAYISEVYNEDAGQFTRPNEDLLFNKAHHLTLGYYHQLNARWRLGAEVYYQALFNMVVGVDLPISRVGGYDYTFTGFDLDNGGTGQNYGLEIVLERSFYNGYYFLTNTSLFESNYTPNDGITRPTTFNANYIFNVVGGKEWKVGKKRGKANFLNLNLSATHSGSQYYTPIDLPGSIEQGFFIFDYNNPNTAEQDPLFLVDASVIYKRNRKKSNSQLTLQVTNILNQRPIIGPIFDRENESSELFLGTGFIPVLSWRINF